MGRVEPMFLDELIQFYSRQSSMDGGAKLVNSSELNRSIMVKHVEVLNRAKLFLLNGAVVDSLYHLPAEATNYDAMNHRPFPVIFFELMDSIEVMVLNGRGGNLKGILFGEADMASPLIGSYFTNSNPKKLGVTLFYMGDNRLTDFVDYTFFNPDIAPNITTTPSLRASDLFNNDDISQKLDKNAYDRLVRLCINVFDYINAHNATIRKTERETRNIGAINRKRGKRGKKLIRPLQPYYWIDVVQPASYEKRAGRSDWTMDYREWVRGHFQSYHTRKGPARLWKDPYVRGPVDKPFKEVKHRVLDDMLKKGPRYAGL